MSERKTYAVTERDPQGQRTGGGVTVGQSAREVATRLYGPAPGDRHAYTPRPERLVISGQWGSVTVARV